MNKDIEWENVSTVPSKTFECGYCEQLIASEKAFRGRRTETQGRWSFYVYICHICNRPTYIDESGGQTPQKMFGKSVGIDTEAIDVSSLYNEARRCYSANAFTAATMIGRKLLMNLAVTKGADINQTFQHYVDYLAEHHYIPVGTKEWVDIIRTQGNEANHEIALSTQEQAEDLLSFTEMLLRIVYEFPGKALKYKKQGAEQDKS